MTRLVAGAASAALLIAWTASGAGAGGAEDVSSPTHCTTFSTGTEARTGCAPSASAPPGSAIACHNYTVGQDIHVECAAVAAPRLSGFLRTTSRPAEPAPALRCTTYHIGSSVYTDCR